MSRTKQKREIHHKPSTHDLLYSLEAMPKWVDTLLQQSEKSYHTFIKWYSDKGFSKGFDKITMKQLSIDFGSGNPGRITKWIEEAYNDILLLHLENPDIFKQDTGIRQHYFIRNWDDVTNLTMWLPVIPRMYEEVRIPFLKGKFGMDFFWVSKVTYDINEDDMSATVWLKGGFGNPYRDMLFHRADFEGRINFFDKYQKHDHEIDKDLLFWYK